MKKKELIVLVLILVAIITRFLFIVDGVSVLPNFTAVGAIAIIGASHFKGIRKWLIPLVVLWLSDLILNNIVYAQYYDHFQVVGSLWVYGSILLIGVLAYFVMQKPSWGRLVFTSFGAAIIFYLVTNFGSWISPASPYVKDFNGLMLCYEMGIPFFRNTLLGNLFFSFVLFGAYELIASRLSDIESVINKKALA